MSAFSALEKPGSPVIDVSSLVAPASQESENGGWLVSRYPEEFLCAFQLTQMILSRTIVTSDSTIEQAIQMHPHPSGLGMTVIEMRERTLAHITKFNQIATLLIQLNAEANQHMVAEQSDTEPVFSYQYFPIFPTYGGIRCYPAMGGWLDIDKDAIFSLDSPEGEEISREVAKTWPWLWRCIAKLVQMSPLELTQAELDILYAFRLHDRRFVLGQAERDLLIARRTPVVQRTEYMNKILQETQSALQ